MRDANELDATLLERRLLGASQVDDSATATRIARVAQLAERGDTAQAAREAADLIEGRIYDVRLIGYYLLGLFEHHGLSYLPLLLGRVAALLTEDFAALRPVRRKAQITSSASAWLFENLASRLLFHSKLRDATWDAWRATGDGALVEAIAAGCTKVSAALEAALIPEIDAPLALPSLARIRRWANEDLRRALARRDEPAARTPSPSPTLTAGVATARPGPTTPTASPSDEDVERVERAEPAQATAPSARAGAPPAVRRRTTDDTGLPAALAEEVDPDDARRAPEHLLEARLAQPAPDAVVAIGSPALASLQAKLRGFQHLIARGEFAKAAVVANDVRAALAAFDPMIYFPSMFASYFKVLHQAIDELEPYLDSVERPSWHALDAYYRSDMHAFFEE